MKRGFATAVIFDIDGTLADCSHRRHLVELSDDPTAYTQKKNWPEFVRRAPLDPVVHPIRKLLFQLMTLNHIVLATGRMEDQRPMTVEWLAEKRIPYSALFMRPLEDYRPDSIVKLEMLARIRQYYDPWIVVDDRDSVVKMWRDAGLTCLQCAPGDF